MAQQMRHARMRSPVRRALSARKQLMMEDRIINRAKFEEARVAGTEFYTHDPAALEAYQGRAPRVRAWRRED